MCLCQAAISPVDAYLFRTSILPTGSLTSRTKMGASSGRTWCALARIKALTGPLGPDNRAVQQAGGPAGHTPAALSRPLDRRRCAHPNLLTAIQGLPFHAVLDLMHAMHIIISPDRPASKPTGGQGLLWEGQRPASGTATSARRRGDQARRQLPAHGCGPGAPRGARALPFRSGRSDEFEGGWVRNRAFQGAFFLQSGLLSAGATHMLRQGGRPANKGSARPLFSNLDATCRHGPDACPRAAAVCACL
jgi:hypothetical protein